MKVIALISVLFLSSAFAAVNDINKTKDLSEFPNLPGDGPYGGHSRKPNPLNFDNKTRTLREEKLWPFQKQTRGDNSRKFIVSLYQINEDGTILTRQILELYPGDRHCLMNKHVHMRTLKPFLFRSLPIAEDCYGMKELEHWQFRQDGTLERITKETFDMQGHECSLFCTGRAIVTGNVNSPHVGRRSRQTADSERTGDLLPENASSRPRMGESGLYEKSSERRLVSDMRSQSQIILGQTQYVRQRHISLPF